MFSSDSWKLFTIIGTFNGALCMTFSRSVDLDSMDMATAIMSTSSLVTSLLACKLLSERLRKIQLL